MEGSAAAVMTTTTGARIDQQLSFTWGLENVDAVLKHAALINAQQLEFFTGSGTSGGVGDKVKWIVYLFSTPTSRLPESFGIWYTLVDKSTPLTNTVYSQMSVRIKNLRGATIWEGESELNVEAINFPVGFPKALNFRKLVDPTGPRQSRWNIHVTFKLYSAKKQSDQIGVTPPLEQFQGNATVKAREDLRDLLKNPVGGDVKIISGDGKEFSIPKGILTTRSPYFEAMLRSDMAESMDGLIRLPTITGKTLEILLNFILTGELLPGWKEPGVILELTNAAAEYQLPDLLDFLDMSLGKVCRLDNVVQLFTLANKLGLKRAEKELLKFTAGKGVTSTKSFLTVISGFGNNGQ